MAASNDSIYHNYKIEVFSENDKLKIKLKDKTYLPRNL